MRTRLALGGVLLALLAGCSSAHHTPASKVPLVAWDGAVPAQLQAHPVTATSPCRAAQLRVVGAGFLFSPTLAGGTGSATVRNNGPHPCRLTDRPDVRIVGAVPSPLQDQVDLPAEPPEFPKLAPPADSLLALPAGATATLTIDWRNWCVAAASRGGKPPVPPRAVRITLPAGRGSLDVDYNAVPQCDASGRPSTVGVRPWQPTPLATTQPWSATAVLAKIMPLSGTGPISGKRGQAVPFAVELHNPSIVPVTFDTCPLVIEMLAPNGQPEAHPLNCRAAGTLTPNGRVRFEMRIQVPANAPLGPNGLFWELDPTGAQGPEAVSRIVVAR